MNLTARSNYSTTSETTREVCKVIGAAFDVRFVETLRRNGKVYVRGTSGKPEEFRWLRRQCEDHGYVYTGRIGATL